MVCLLFLGLFFGLFFVLSFLLAREGTKLHIPFARGQQPNPANVDRCTANRMQQHRSAVANYCTVAALLTTASKPGMASGRGCRCSHEQQLTGTNITNAISIQITRPAITRDKTEPGAETSMIKSRACRHPLQQRHRARRAFLDASTCMPRTDPHRQIDTRSAGARSDALLIAAVVRLVVGGATSDHAGGLAHPRLDALHQRVCLLQASVRARVRASRYSERISE